MVTRTELHPKDQLPNDEIWGATDQRELRLITCGGSFDASRRSYRDNVVVWAQPVGNA